jgi:excisionase family DNA binding protein
MEDLQAGGSNLLSMRETADLLRVNPETVGHLLRSGVIDGFKIGSNWRIRVNSINHYIEHQSAKCAAPAEVYEAFKSNA